MINNLIIYFGSKKKKKIIDIFYELGILRNSSSSSTTSENNGERKDGKENINQVRETNGEIKQLILEASLKFVPQYGWSSLALAEGN